jgi:hypothetical protein
LEAIVVKPKDMEGKPVRSPHESEDFSSEGEGEHKVEGAIADGAQDIHGDGTTVEVRDGEFVFDAAMETRLNWKCDLKLLPPLIGLFVITFIDRTNIANAKIEGMTTELKMAPNNYNMSLWILNIPYIVLAVPSNMLMKRGFVRPAVYLSGIMFCWCKRDLLLSRSLS